MVSFHCSVQVFLALKLLFHCSNVSDAVWYPKSLPCDVKENAKEAALLVDCTDRRLTKIPQAIPSNVTNLTLTINHIPTISPTSFLHLQSLVEIDFRCNCVPVRLGPKDNVCTNRLKIEDGSFKSLTHLRSLYLDGNQLLQIPRGLPTTLKLLSLEANTIFSIVKENLTELVNLENLYLGQNCYYRNPCNRSFHIENNTFYNLTHLSVLSLKDNNLSYVPGRFPPSLRELYLYNNMIQRIHKDDFQNLSHLEILVLNGNCPRCYNAPFPCIPCPNNAAIDIANEAFDSLRNLKTLRLSSNSLRIIKRDWFKNITQLQVLDLSKNFLAKEIGEARFLTLVPNLLEIDLSFNFELQVYSSFLKLSKHFSNLLSLEIFRVKGYVFKELDIRHLRPLINLKNISVLDLGTNFIKIANLSLFQIFPALSRLDLSVNRISPASQSGQGSFSNFGYSENPYRGRMLPNMHYFRYDENGRSCKFKEKENIPFVPYVNKDCSDYGKTLDLSLNNIFFINANDYYQLSILKCLNLSGNAISQPLNGSELRYLRNLKYLDFSSNRLDFLYPTAFKELKVLEVLDLSNNQHYFQAEGITHMLNFTYYLPKLTKLLMNYNEISSSTSKVMNSESLEILEFKGNRLDILWKDGDSGYLGFFSNLTNLRCLDISENSLQFLPPGSFEGMPPNLEVLNVTNNKLHTFNWGKLHLLLNLKVLDLGNNQLTTVPRELSNCTSSLTAMILRNNLIKKLTEHFLRGASELQFLDLSGNKIETINKTSFPENVINNLKTLLLQGNPFKCNCDAVWFVWWINQTTVDIPRLATDVTCVGPGAHRGKSLILLDLYTCDSEFSVIILHSVTVSVILFLMLITTLNHLFYWDLWYSYHFCAAKLKGSRRFPSVGKAYDAFVAYDIKDAATAEWVFEELVTNLEGKGGKQLNLCLEERDWIPGLSIFANLSESIRISRKTIFVLTRKYSQSGHFRTAFNMAHQWLIDEKMDVILFIFLEKVLQNSRYVRLRKRLYKRSVLDWPTNPQAQFYFWHCLRNALKLDSQMAYDKLLKEIM